MAQDKDALARLDSKLAELFDYVRSDEATDAAEVDKRTADVQALLDEVKGSGEVPTEETEQREQQLADAQAEANAQTQE